MADIAIFWNFESHHKTQLVWKIWLDRNIFGTAKTYEKKEAVSRQDLATRIADNQKSLSKSNFYLDYNNFEKSSHNVLNFLENRKPSYFFLYRRQHNLRIFFFCNFLIIFMSHFWWSLIYQCHIDVVDNASLQKKL